MPFDQNSSLREAYGISDTNLTALRSLADEVMGHLDTLLDEFYDMALSDPEHAAFFPNQGLIDHARSKQIEHWKLMFAGDLDAEYVESAKRIGRVHYKIGLPFTLYIPAYARMGARLQELMLASREDQAGGRRKSAANGGVRMQDVIGAITKLLMVDVYLAVSSYFEAQEQNHADELHALGSRFDADIGGIVRSLSTEMTKLEKTPTILDPASISSTGAPMR